MNIVRYVQDDENATEIATKLVVENVEQDSEDCYTVYLSEGYYLILTRDDLEKIKSV